MVAVRFYEPAPGILSWVHPDPPFMQRAGHAVRAGGGVWVLDPPLGDEVLDRVRDLGRPAGVVQALDRHPRDCAAVADALGVGVHVTPTRGVTGAPFRALRLWDLPGWHEVALWFGAERTLFVPEALAAAPAFVAPGEGVGVHPARRLLPPTRLRDVVPLRLLLGHGPPVTGDAAHAAVLAALAGSRRRAPAVALNILRNLPRPAMTGPPDLVQTLMAPAAEPPFHDELSRYWGAEWGAADEVGPLRKVLVRDPGDGLRQVRGDAWNEAAGALVDPAGQWYWTRREPPDLERVHAQHAGLVAALRAEGVEVVVADPEPTLARSVYTRDPLVTVPGGAIIGRMAVRMRRGEEAGITKIVAGEGLPILSTITGTGTLEGGSFTKLRPGLAAVGTSIRVNDEGARQLGDVLARIGWQLLVVPLSGYTIHIDLHLAMVDVDKALVNAAGLPFWFLERLKAEGIEAIHPDPSEAWALNALTLRPGRVLMATGSPRTVQTLTARGIDVVEVPYDELHPNGGGVHCSTMELLREPAS